MIPKIIHQIWFQGIDKIIEPYKTCFIESIKFINYTKWDHKFWDKETIDDLIKNNYPQYFDLYNNCPILVQKIDIARYIILYHYGGCYMDMDVKIIKDFNDLIDDTDELIVSDTHQKFINNGILFSSKNNNFWIDFLNDLKPKVNRFTFSKLLCVNFSTGPLNFTNFVKKNINTYKIKILPYKYLEPCETKYHQVITEDAYVINYYGNSWVDSYFSIFLFIYCYRKLLLILIIIMIAIIIKIKYSN
jgi:mannosyltransferase OCH1-like enzyme